MDIKKRFLLTAVMAAGTFAAVHSAASADVIQELHDALPEEYRKNGIDVAVFNDWPPDEFVENGELKGWSVELAREISDRLGVEFNFSPIGFDGIIPGLVGGRYDIGVSSFGATEERLQSLDFIAQRKAGTGFAVKAGADIDIDADADLCGLGVAILAGSWDHQLLESMNKEVCATKGLDPIDIQQFPTQAAAELSVLSERTDTTAAASAKLRYLAQQTGDFEVKNLVVEAVYSCLGIRRDDPLGPIVTKAIQAIMDDGTYMEIMTRWGLEEDGPIDEARLITAANFEAE